VAAVALRGDKPGGGRAHSAAAQRNALPVSCLVQLAKRIVDIAAATIGLLLFSPLLLIASIAIKLESRGPLFVRETRYGYTSLPIPLLRFRLMTARPENDLAGPQLTRVGRILSQTGIDELPQLFNVLRGEISLVGPQPCRHPRASLNRVKPGMIRWAQIVATREERPEADPDM
jgi:lipopolysaccharide/colanic/teichoic acid biosynthesis glycosyltransferase